MGLSTFIHTSPVPAEEAGVLGVEACVYLYPLVLASLGRSRSITPTQEEKGL
jgi:hypothetical protein